MQSAKMEIITFEAQDVIATSGELKGIWLSGSTMASLINVAPKFLIESQSGNFTTNALYSVVPQGSYEADSTLYHLTGNYSIGESNDYARDVNYLFEADSSYSGADGQTFISSVGLNDSRTILYWLDANGTLLQ